MEKTPASFTVGGTTKAFLENDFLDHLHYNQHSYKEQEDSHKAMFLGETIKFLLLALSKRALRSTIYQRVHVRSVCLIPEKNRIRNLEWAHISLIKQTKRWMYAFLWALTITVVAVRRRDFNGAALCTQWLLVFYCFYDRAKSLSSCFWPNAPLLNNKFQTNHLL